MLSFRGFHEGPLFSKAAACLAYLRMRRSLFLFFSSSGRRKFEQVVRHLFGPKHKIKVPIRLVVEQGSVRGEGSTACFTTNRTKS